MGGHATFAEGLRDGGGRLVALGLSAGHAARAQWRRLSPAARRRLLSLPPAVLLHLGILLALMAGPATRQLGLGPSLEQGGRPDAFRGRGLSVSLVSLAQLGEIGRDTPATARSRDGGAPMVLAEARARPITRPIEDALLAGGAARPGDDARLMEASEQASAAAAAAQGQAQRDALQSGDAEEGQNLLRQIGRCLPPDQRPALLGVNLAIQLDADGQLTAAPGLDITPVTTSPDALRQANLVIQAALQCGPYQVRDRAVTAYALVADFSFLGPPTAAPPRVMRRHGR